MNEKNVFIIQFVKSRKLNYNIALTTLSCVLFLESIPTRNTQRTKSKSIMEVIPCYFRHDRAFRVLFKGKMPEYTINNKSLTKRKRQSLLGKAKKKNPVLEGHRYLEFLEQNPGLTYKNVADEFDITKARVSQMIAIVKKLPQEITNYFMSNNESLDLSYFTERKLRPLTLLKSDKTKIEMFCKMKEGMV